MLSNNMTSQIVEEQIKEFGNYRDLFDEPGAFEKVEAFLRSFASTLIERVEDLFCSCRGRSYVQTIKGYRGICRTCSRFIDDEQRTKLQEMK